MLFPGAIIIVGIILITVGICFSVVVSALCGIITVRIIKIFLRKTGAYKRRESGYSARNSSGDPFPWWVDDKYLLFGGWVIWSCIIAYTIAGPIGHLIMWLK